MFQLFHETDLANSSAGRALFAVKVDLFEGNIFAGLAIAAFEDLSQ